MSVNIPYADPDQALAPPVLLALSYAPREAREGLAALLALDGKLGGIVRASREPMVGQMRLTWWHDALTRLDSAGPPAEPVLQAIAEHVLPAGVTGGSLASIIDGWEILLEGDTLSEAELATYANARGGRLFAAMALLCRATGADPVAGAGEGWALADLARHVSDPVIAEHASRLAEERLDQALAVRWSRRGRVLGALALLARRPAGGPALLGRLIWHRLSGY
ncbi:hypothetical protein GCM10011380_20860 [Sphingomonas metalli]|uniref:Phytoene synthase n=1 Tax=Sphingomonas metalli TaxID=1779358 RepID=A0A916WTH5_9SPHN|nr:squalene/phytoene synthase family protein [Sphingomonas metalli]GGB31323.1 hypothetical protein GCM10011380_20860 [Sphingomonas metalli]